MNLRELKEIIKIIQEAEIDELEIEREGERIKIKKTSGVHPVSVVSDPVPSAMIYSQPAPAPVSGETNEAAKEKPEIKEEVLGSINSPMVGTFYRSPGPDTDPYIAVGSEVKKGQVLCIIEAMKLMNEIESEVDGKIVEILVENGQSVEYGQTLFKIEPKL